ncbi:hypothetical protein BD770DRAFT_425680 [Pilaira anomala]|nr:hypothetical protein BD770DRAFT_425680 [Pilaira anomala]
MFMPMLNNPRAGLLDYENRQKSLNSYQRIKFISFNPSSSKKKNQDHPPQPPRPRVIVSEIDGIFIQGLDSSTDSFIQTLANNSQVTDRKTKHFITLGMNSTLDITDRTEGSRLSQILNEVKKACKDEFEPS